MEVFLYVINGSLKNLEHPYIVTQKKETITMTNKRFKELLIEGLRNQKIAQKYLYF